MTTPAPSFTEPAPAERLETVATALKGNGFEAEILHDAAAARARVKELVPEGATVFTGASETLRLSGIAEDLNGERYASVRTQSLAMDRTAQRTDIRRLLGHHDVIVGSVHAVTETGSLVIGSASGSQLTGYTGGADHAIWVVGAQKVVPDVETGLRRLETHCTRLEDERAMKAYGVRSALNRVLILHAFNPNYFPGRGTVLLLREAIGF
ncbi:LUD domain-containing protein [Streptomyces sp. CMB-StM0423]|uniref:LUD domain-containing protein n=1 Tax=Streptomyces sp. CMB-StM0423 TaxID=2059884 RepID=UPI000C704779|nr:LUD domain-containing protein [Streptomyces sp. CMB-StM0423]AUH40601.1 hypothetical protein CXR04_10385 [Streptomyces sp. CMB-StM0423]